VPRFVTPTLEQVRTVLAESHGLWGAGLSVPDYLGMWEEMAESRWGRSWYSWRALVDDDGRVLSSLKLYRPALRLGETEGRAAAIGAVFTPRALRRCGHAATLIRATLDEAAARGDVASLLFTDIGTGYYASLGFTALPCEDTIGTIAGAAVRGPRGVTLRPMTLDDLDLVSRTQHSSCAARALAILRDTDHWEFLLLRAETFFRRLDGSSLDGRFVIAMDGSRPIGYVVAVSGPGEWNLREAEAFDLDPATLARVLHAGAAEANARGATTVWGWMPRSARPLLPSWRLRSQTRHRAIPMLLPLDGHRIPGPFDDVDRAFIPYLDQF
jgi:GNAT superfamily N-acetyltransferase